MGMVQFTMPGGRFRASATTLKFMIEWAWDLQPAQHSGGPAWLGEDRYDVVAKAEGNPTDAEMKLMLQNLLAERFHLEVRQEKKKLQAFVISLGKTEPKLGSPKEGEPRSLKVMPVKDADQKTTTFHVVATRYSLTQLAYTFARQIGRPMLNQTGLDGDYDFTLDFAPDESTPNPLDPTLVMNAMRNQLGLTLKTQDALVDYLVIEKAEKVTAGN